MYIIQKIKSWLSSAGEENPEKAYDKWSAAYDEQPGNLVLDLDHLLFKKMLCFVTLSGKNVLDIGCGTGRHWPLLYNGLPGRLIGYDISAGMLAQLRRKYEEAELYQCKSELLPEQSAASIDVIISTLALAHIKNISDALAEWNRVLKAKGIVIITDYHPAILARGGKRTFKSNGKTIAVKSYVHPLETLRKLAEQLGWKECRFVQTEINDEVRKYYEEQNALIIYEKYKETPLVYAIQFEKA